MSSRTRRGPGRGGVVLHVLGELALTLGVVAVLFVVWQLWWTDRVGAADARAEVGALQRAWGAGPAPARPVVLTRPPADGTAFAVLRVPRFGAGWRQPVLQGTGGGTLRRGVGHYARTALPGATGNVGLAGHRTTWGHPFGDLDRLRVGDAVVLDTRGGRFTYRVTGRRIVDPSAGGVLRAVPGKALLTLTTCHPRYSARQRLVVRAELAGAEPRVAGRAA